LEGKKFVCGQLESIEAVAPKCENSAKIGYFVHFGETGDSPDTFNFYFQHNNAVTSFQKKVKAGEKITFGKWGILLY
jgi:hypothetical protein